MTRKLWKDSYPNFPLLVNSSNNWSLTVRTPGSGLHGQEGPLLNGKGYCLLLVSGIYPFRECRGRLEQPWQVHERGSAPRIQAQSANSKIASRF